jgi:DNA-binding NarL/FixJ family response regulator
MSRERFKDRKLLMEKTCTYCGGTGALAREDASVPCQKEEQAPLPSAASTLSAREKQIVELVQRAKSNKEIAHELKLTVGTVKEYVYHIFRKVGVANRTELALWGRDYGQTQAAS